MDDILKKLVKENVLNEETKDAIKASFSKSLDEAKAAQEKKIRAEFAEQYDKDKAAMHEAFGQFLEQEMKEHVSELREGIEQVNEMKLELARKHSKIKESAQEYVKKRLGAMEKVIEGVLKDELSGVHEDVVTMRRAYLNKMNEGEARVEQEREKFRKKASAFLENVINVRVNEALDELKEDIVAARQADFGREIYESFHAAFRRQFFNASGEFRDLTKRLKESEARSKKLEEAAKKKLRESAEARKLAEAKARKLEETMVRKQKMDRLLSGLNGDARRTMKSLLETTKTADLEKQFRKFIPEVVKESKKGQTTPKRRKLEETAVELKTGGKENLKEANPIDEFDDEIAEIRRRAGGQR